MLAPIRHTATYEIVVDQIRRVIFLGRYLPGDKLPPERELAQQLGVSRTTVREAVRILEGESLIRVKRGAQGGIIVTGQALQEAERTTFTAEQQRALVDIFDYRFAIELRAVRLAAERRDSGDVAILTEAVAQMNALVETGHTDAISIAEYNALDTRFHTRIAEASRNAFLVRAVEEIRAEMFQPVGSIFERLSEKANEHHDPILQAIAARDPDRAEAVMHQHLTYALTGLQRLFDR